MAAYRRIYDSRHLQSDCQEPGSAPEPYARQSMGYFYLLANSHSHARHDTDRTVLSCLAGGVNWQLRGIGNLDPTRAWIQTLRLPHRLTIRSAVLAQLVGVSTD